MKNLIVLAFLLIAKISIAQQKDTVGLNVPYANGEIVYEKVFNTPGKTADELFANSQLWFVKHYKNLNSIQIQDDVIRRVVGHGSELLTFKAELGRTAVYQCNITVQIDCKEGRYRVRIFNAVIEMEDTTTRIKYYTHADQIVESLLGMPEKLTSDNSRNSFNKNQSKKALISLNSITNDVMSSINQSMNDRDNF